MFTNGPFVAHECRIIANPRHGEGSGYFVRLFRLLLSSGYTYSLYSIRATRRPDVSEKSIRSDLIDTAARSIRPLDRYSAVGHLAFATLLSLRRDEEIRSTASRSSVSCTRTNTWIISMTTHLSDSTHSERQRRYRGVHL